jgi:CheY-like chemotaxis protein
MKAVVDITARTLANEGFRPSVEACPNGMAQINSGFSARLQGGQMTAIRVLHVDDDADIREVVAGSLSLDPDFTVRSCASGEEALVVAAAWLPDIVLLDVMMPVMDGPTTLAGLRRNPRTAAIPVVLMTARAQSRELDLFRSYGAAGVIGKPFNPVTLATEVRHYVRPADDWLEPMRKGFLRRAWDDADVLASQRSALEQEVVPPALLKGIRDLAHALAGAGSIFGFPDIGGAAADLEQSVIECAGPGSLTAIGQALDRLLACVETKRLPGEQPTRVLLRA